MWNFLARYVQYLPAEMAHDIAVATLRYNLGPKPRPFQSRANLSVGLAGLGFANPLGLAAGFDKNAACFNGAMNIGFGHVEVGTITPLPQPGNPKPRIFRIPEHKAVINRYGFNSLGSDVVAKNLETSARKRSGVLGVNIGANKTSKNPIDDYRKVAARLAPYADYIALNISSPNTPGIRNLQTKEHLGHLLSAGLAGCSEAGFGPADVKQKPIFLKIAPDLHLKELAPIVESCIDFGISGIIATNTTLARPSVMDKLIADESGGLSGSPLFNMSTHVLAEVAKINESHLGLIGVGGVASGWQVYTKILVGADLVQIYTGLAFDGPYLPRSILCQFAAMMDLEGIATVNQLRGQIPDPVAAIKHSLAVWNKLSC